MQAILRFDMLAVIAAGGAAGAVLRYLSYAAVQQLTGPAFPFGTLFVNVAGSLAMGFLYVWLSMRLPEATNLRALLLVGFLGSFTTFSTFSVETLNLILQGQWIRSATNIVASVFICIAAAWLGMLAAEQL